MAGKRGETLLDLMGYVEKYTLARAWTDLSDDELLWEPTAECWSVRPMGESQTATPFVVGDWVADFDAQRVMAAIEGRAVEPLTTIGWLLWHVGSVPGRTAELDFLGGVHTADSGWTSPYIAVHPVFTSADEAVAVMEAGWRALEGALGSATDDQLEVPIRFWGYGGPGPMGTGSQLVASVLNEISHHGTQVCVLRDLYRSRRL